MRTLRQHVEEAMKILSSLGGPTILPSASNVIVRRRQKKRWRRNPVRQSVRPDIAGKRRDYAISIKILCEANDRTGYMVEWLTASDDTASEVWQSIPDRMICFECRVGRPIPDCRCKGRCACRECPKCKRRMLTLVGIVCADLQSVAKALRNGGVRVAIEGRD